ncbi:hypothetical protein VTO58DRAFT_107604 [Aureobasidium pullulans]
MRHGKRSLDVFTAEWFRSPRKSTSPLGAFGSRYFAGFARRRAGLDTNHVLASSQHLAKHLTARRNPCIQSPLLVKRQPESDALAATSAAIFFSSSDQRTVWINRASRLSLTSRPFVEAVSASFFFLFLPLKSFRGTTKDLKRIGLAEHHPIGFGTKRWHPFHERRLLQHRLNRRIHFLFACAHAISAATSAFEDPHRRLHVVGASATLLHPPVLILLSSGISIKVFYWTASQSAFAW